MTKKTEQDPFNAFGWDEATSEIDFFGEVEKSVNPEKEDEATEVEEEEESTETKEEENKEEEDKDVFQDFEKVEEEEEEEEEENPTDPKGDSTTNIKSSVKHLFDEGILSLDEDEELPEEIDNEYLTSKIEASIEKKFEESIAGLPDEVKNIIKYVHNGGALKDIISTVTEDSGISEDIDMDEERNQEKVLKHLLKEEGEDDELIEAQIEFFKDSGKLSSIAQKKFDKWKKDKKADAEKLIEYQKKQKALARENQNNFRKGISELLSNNEEVKGLTVSKKEIKELPNYIGNTYEKLQYGIQITPFYRDLFEALKDEEKMITLAKLVKNDFDFGDMKKDIATKQSQKLKEDLQRQSNNKPKRSSQKKSRLIDYL